MTWLSVGLGGALGAMSRYGLAVVLTSDAHRLPVATFAANIIGAFLIGVLYVLILEKSALSENLRPLLMVGFLGGLTTFSTFSLESVQLMESGKILLACAYMLTSVVLCLGAVWIGMITTRML